MKNLLNRLTRFMIIMLLLVDRTPFFNVYASASFKLEIDYTDSLVNAGLGLGQYDMHYFKDDSTWNHLDCIGLSTTSTSDQIKACLATYGITPESIMSEALKDKDFD